MASKITTVLLKQLCHNKTVFNAQKKQNIFFKALKTR